MKIKVTDIRIGNILSKGIVTSIGYKDGVLGAYLSPNKFDSSEGYFYPESELEGVKINEKELILFGFEKIDELNFIKEGDDECFEIYKHYGDRFPLAIRADEATTLYFCHHVGFVHQLQNLYHSFMGEELIRVE